MLKMQQPRYANKLSIGNSTMPRHWNPHDTCATFLNAHSLSSPTFRDAFIKARRQHFSIILLLYVGISRRLRGFAEQRLSVPPISSPA